jgi:acetyltransferase-like isoleucine patch superfamily enzyme
MPKNRKRWTVLETAKVLWAVASCFVVESIIFGISVLPASVFWQWHFSWALKNPLIKMVLLSMAFIPAYLIFAFSLMVFSGIMTRLTGWQTPRNASMRIDSPDWPLLNWVRYTVSMHLVRIFAGLIFRATPVWSLYMRLNGARIGRRVFVNSLWVSDHNLLEFGNDVIIGSEVHMSGHTVEEGLVKTAAIRLGDGVVLGVNSVIGIGVEIGNGAHIGSLSVVPKFAKLQAGCKYGGVPVKLLSDQTSEDE